MDIVASEFAAHGIEVHGALDFDERPRGISPRRLPPWTRSQIPAELDVIARMPSGVRLRFNTDATEVRLSCLITRMVYRDEEDRAPVFNLELAEGELLAYSCRKGNRFLLDRGDPSVFELERGDAEEVVFSGLPAGPKDVQIWLPQGSYVELRSLSFAGAAGVWAFSGNAPRWVHYGSSISHCVEADQPALTWPAVAARLGGVDLISLGLAGQCQLDQFIARTIGELEPDLVSAKLGINVINGDTMRERVFVPAVHGFLDTLRERCPDTPVLLVSPIYCPAAERHPGPTIRAGDGRFVTVPREARLAEGSLTLMRVRALLAEIVEARDDPQLNLLSGLALFNEDDAGDLPDDLHPNPAGYIRMGSRFAARVFAEDGIWGGSSSPSDSEV